MARRNRPLRAISTLVLAVAAASAVHVAGVPLDVTTSQGSARINPNVSITVGHAITIAGAAAFCVFALVSTFAFGRWARSVLERFIGLAYGDIVRYVMILVGLSVVILATLSMLGFRVAQLVVGGAVTGVLFTIAAQQALSNLFAGMMLQFARPFRVGDRVRITAGSLGGPIEGTVTEFSISYVRMETDTGRVLLPNAQVLAAAISPAPSSTQVPPPSAQRPAAGPPGPAAGRDHARPPADPADATDGSPRTWRSPATGSGRDR